MFTTEQRGGIYILNHVFVLFCMLECSILPVWLFCEQYIFHRCDQEVLLLFLFVEFTHSVIFHLPKALPRESVLFNVCLKSFILFRVYNRDQC